MAPDQKLIGGRVCGVAGSTKHGCGEKALKSVLLIVTGNERLLNTSGTARRKVVRAARSRGDCMASLIFRVSLA